MNTMQALLEGVLAHPGDPAPRLIFADWLEENGYPAPLWRTPFGMGLVFVPVPAGTFWTGREDWNGLRQATRLMWRWWFSI